MNVHIKNFYLVPSYNGVMYNHIVKTMFTTSSFSGTRGINRYGVSIIMSGGNWLVFCHKHLCHIPVEEIDISWKILLCRWDQNTRGGGSIKFPTSFRYLTFHHSIIFPFYRIIKILVIYWSYVHIWQESLEHTCQARTEKNSFDM